MVRPQDSTIEQLQKWLEEDLAQDIKPNEAELENGVRLAQKLRSQDEETAVWDLTQSIAAFHLENRKVDSWRAMWIMLLFEYETKRYKTWEQRLERLIKQTGEDWPVLELIAKILVDYAGDQYAAVSLLYEAKHHLKKPMNEKYDLLKQLIAIDYEVKPEYLYRLGKLEVRLNKEEYSDHLSDALDIWLRTNSTVNAVKAAKGLLSSNSALNALIPSWCGRIAELSPQHALQLLDWFTAKAREQNQTFVADALRTVLEVMPPSEEAFSEIAKFSARIQQHDFEEKIWKRVLSFPAEGIPIDQEVEYKARAALVCLYDPAGPLDDPDALVAHALQAARTAPDVVTSVNFYERLMPSWDWKRITEEIAWVEENPGMDGIEAGLLKRWLQIHADDDTCLMVLGFMAKNDRFRKWHIASVAELIEDIPPRLLIQFDELARLWITLHAETDRKVSNPFVFAKLGINLVLNGHSLEVKEAKKLAQVLFKDLGDADAKALRKEHIKTPEALQRLQGALSVNISPVSLPAFACWLNWFSPVLTSSKPEAALNILNQAAKKVEQIRDAESTGEHPGLREDLKKLVFHLLADSEMKQPAHQAWLKLSSIWPDEILPYLMHCLTMEPPETELAESCLDLFLQQEDADFMNFADMMQSSHLIGRSKRIDLVLELLKCIERLTTLSDIPTTPELKGYHFASIATAFRFREDVNRADMAAAFIGYLRKSVRSPRWLTPVSHHVEALVYANRFEEANQVTAKHTELTIGRKREPAQCFVDHISRTGKPRIVPNNKSDYKRIIKSMTTTWPIFG